MELKLTSQRGKLLLLNCSVKGVALASSPLEDPSALVFKRSPFLASVSLHISVNGCHSRPASCRRCQSQLPVTKCLTHSRRRELLSRDGINQSSVAASLCFQQDHVLSCINDHVGIHVVKYIVFQWVFPPYIQIISYYTFALNLHFSSPKMLGSVFSTVAWYYTENYNIDYFIILPLMSF